MAQSGIAGSVLAWFDLSQMPVYPGRLAHSEMMRKFGWDRQNHGDVYEHEVVACVSVTGEYFLWRLPCDVQLEACAGYDMEPKALEAAKQGWTQITRAGRPDCGAESFTFKQDNSIAKPPVWDSHLCCLTLLVKAVLRYPPLLARELIGG